MNQSQSPVIFVHARFKNTHHIKAFKAGQDARRSHGSLRSDDRQLVANPHRQRIGQRLAENDAKSARVQIRKGALNHLAADVGNLLLLLRQNALHQRAADQRSMIQHRFAANKGGAALDFGMAHRLIADRLPILHQSVPVVDGGVSSHREDSPAQFLLKAVHHRQHGDQCGDAERDAQH